MIDLMAKTLNGEHERNIASRTDSSHELLARHAESDRNHHAPAHARKTGVLSVVLRSLGLIFLAILLSGTSAAATMYYKLQANVQQHQIVRAPTKKAKPTIPIDQKAGQPLNILLLGSDARPEENEEGVEGMRADTTMLVHISADRSRVDVISIPRDTLVEIPECTLPDGNTTWPQSNAMFNSAFMIGGSTGDVGAAASCTLATAERMSGLTIDGFAVVNFQSFQDVVGSIGGVDMCFAEDVHDADAQLNISAGCHTLDGAQALAIARARHALGDGSDLSRIGRQQELVFQILKKLFSMNVFTNTQTFYQVATGVTKNLDTSEGLGNLPFLGGLAYSLKGLDFENNVNFMTLPVYNDPHDPNRVRENAQASILWEAVKNDKPIPASAIQEAPEQSEVVVRNRHPKDPTTSSPKETGDSADSTTSESDTPSH